MPTLSEYFETEARTYLEQLRELMGAAPPDADAVHRAARALRGSAQMAREDRVYRAGLALESAARAVAGASLSWTDELLDSARAAVDDLRALVERSESDGELESRLSGSLERWQNAGLALPAPALGQPPAPRASSESMEFRSFAAQEVEGIADALDQGVRDLSGDPMNREALKSILRRQRALLGSARLDDIPVVAETLRAVEDLTRVIAKLDIGVKQEWLDIYRVAREGLKATITPLRADQDPPTTHALARLRHLRAELMERYGAGEAVSAAASHTEGLAQAQRVADEASAQVRATTFSPPRPETPAAPAVAEPARAEDSVVSVTELEYRGTDALRRALELRPTLESALGGNRDHFDALDELFDLIRLALD